MNWGAGLGNLPVYLGPNMADPHQVSVPGTTTPGLLPEFISRQAVRQRELGRAPAAQPTKLIQQPIWWNPRKATRYSTASRSYTMRDAGVDVVYVAETSNAVPNPIGGPTRATPHGLLRYSDLDVLIALSYHFTRYGKPLVEVDQRTVLTWMGYQQFDEAPYRELRASLQRIASTTISVSMKGAKIAEYIPSRLVSLHNITEGGGHGGKGTIVASLTEEWRQSLGKGFTLVDMHAYAHLCRVDRECGLARVLYLFLASVKDHQTGEFNLPVSWIAERWRDTTGVDQVPIFADPLDRKGILYEALSLLHASGVMTIGEAMVDDRGRPTDDRRLCGVFAPSTNIPRIPEESTPRQVSLFVPNRLTGAPIPATAALSPMSSGVSEDEQDGNNGMALADVLRSEKALFIDASIAALVQDLGLSQRVIRKAMRTEDWADRAAMARVLLHVSWKYHTQGGIEKPAAYAMKILEKGAADDPQWASTEADAQAWALGSQGPLSRLGGMRERIRRIEQEIKRQPVEERGAPTPGLSDPPTESALPVDIARRAIAKMGARISDERIALLATMVDERRIMKTADRLQDDWLEEDANQGDDGSDNEVDEALLAAIARELSSHRDVALRLGYDVAPLSARFVSAAKIASSNPALVAWRKAISGR